MAERLRALVVEDVPLAQAALMRLLRHHEDVTVIGQAADIREAREFVDQGGLDLAFLDVRLPDGSGVALARDWPDPKPQFVFITATPEHAVDAFALDADDYLLKPITTQGLERALNRVRRNRSHVPSPPVQSELIEIRENGRTTWLDPKLIDFVDVAGHYLCLHVGRDIHLLRRPIAEFADILGTDFIRIHRSALVRLDRVRVVHERSNGDADAELEDGQRVKLSRSYRAAFDERMANRTLSARG